VKDRILNYYVAYSSSSSSSSMSNSSYSLSAWPFKKLSHIVVESILQMIPFSVFRSSNLSGFLISGIISSMVNPSIYWSCPANKVFGIPKEV